MLVHDTCGSSPPEVRLGRPQACACVCCWSSVTCAQALAAAVVSLGKPTAVFLLNGGGVAVSQGTWGGERVVVIEAFYPGLTGAAAIAGLAAVFLTVSTVAFLFCFLFCFCCCHLWLWSVCVSGVSVSGGPFPSHPRPHLWKHQLVWQDALHGLPGRMGGRHANDGARPHRHSWPHLSRAFLFHARTAHTHTLTHVHESQSISLGSRPTTTTKSTTERRDHFTSRLFPGLSITAARRWCRLASACRTRRSRWR